MISFLSSRYLWLEMAYLQGSPLFKRWMETSLFWAVQWMGSAAWVLIQQAQHKNVMFFSANRPYSWVFLGTGVLNLTLAWACQWHRGRNETELKIIKRGTLMHVLISIALIWIDDSAF